MSAHAGLMRVPPASSAARVLVVEDEPVIRAAIAEGLADSGFVVDQAPDGGDFASRLTTFRPDAVVLDIMLPAASGLQLAEHTRKHSAAAVVFVTARDDIDDRLTGFDLGADDYIVKPFVLAELVARVRAVLRRTGRLRSARVQVGELVVDEDSAQVFYGDHEVVLTATEFRVLAYLTRNRSRVMSKTQILTQVWGYDAYDPNLVETYVSTLRRKLDAHGPRLIHTVRGIGYRVDVT